MRLWNLAVFLGLLAIACTTTTESPPSGDGTATGAGTGTPTQPGKPKGGTTGETKPKPAVDPTTDPSASACTGAAGSSYAVNVTKLDSTNAIPLCRFQGSVMMIVRRAGVGDRQGDLYVLRAWGGTSRSS